MILTSVLLEALDKAIMWLSRIVVGLFVLLTLMAFFWNVLPEDPLQPYIMEFTNTIQPYTALINYFFPVTYMGFAFAFFIAYKYFIMPFKLMVRNVFNADMFMSGYGGKL